MASHGLLSIRANKLLPPHIAVEWGRGGDDLAFILHINSSMTVNWWVMIGVRISYIICYPHPRKHVLGLLQRGLRHIIQSSR